MTETIAEDSFPRRFIYKFGTNLVAVLLSFFQAGFVSRALGPRSYGDYNFLISFFTQFIAFAEMRSATFLYTSISRNRAKTAMVAVYSYVALAISALTVFFPVAAIMVGLQSVVWPDQNGPTIVIVSLVAVIIWYADLFGKISDALGVTISSERARAINRILLFISIGVAMRWSFLNIQSYLTLQLIANFLLIVVLSIGLRRTGAFHRGTLHPSKLEMRSMLGEMFSYSYPLLVYTLFAFTGDYADRWLLQRFNGSFEQGLFSLALNLGLGFNVLINALHPLVMREFSVAFEQQDLQRARKVFTKLIAASYTLSAFLLCYAGVNADGCVRIIAGRSFDGASTVFAVMAFLPILHNYSMLSGSALYAARKTVLLRNIGFVTTPLSILATLLLIGPREYGGLNLGAVGLAVKVVALEFIGNNIVLYFNSKMLGLSFRKLLFHQISIVAFLTTAAFLCREAALGMLGATTNSWFAVMLVGGFMYAVISILVFCWTPAITGVDKREALAFFKEAMSKNSQSSIGCNLPIP